MFRKPLDLLASPIDEQPYRRNALIVTISQPRANSFNIRGR